MDYFFQPIVHSLSGEMVGVEAILSSLTTKGISPAIRLFNNAVSNNSSYELNMHLLSKALSVWKKHHFSKPVRFFYNYDLRILDDPHYDPDEELLFFKSQGIPLETFCLEISEHSRNSSKERFHAFIRRIKQSGMRIVIDDFGAGYAGLELMYELEPYALKFDPFLIRDLGHDHKKGVFCSHVVNLCRMMNVLTIAECVETEEEFLGCKRAGFDLIQGFFLQKPVSDLSELEPIYQSVVSLDLQEQMATDQEKDQALILKEIAVIEPVRIDDSIQVVYNRFLKHPDYRFIPVLDSMNEPLGIIQEQTLKRYIYAPYGRDLLVNKSVSQSLRAHLVSCPKVEISTTQELVLEIFAKNPEIEGVMMTKSFKYVGFLTATSMLKIISERNIASAREMNPLTHLPGNLLISRSLGSQLLLDDHFRILVYFDFNSFKPFNDKFGFRQGDHVIKKFAEISRYRLADSDKFIGHVGGDDFFACWNTDSDTSKSAISLIQQVVSEFNLFALSFFTPEEVSQGFYKATDRSGRKKKIEILRVCAAILLIPPNSGKLTQEEITQIMAKEKKKAKSSSEGVVFSVFLTHN